MQLELKDVKARVERLDQLARGLAREVAQQRGAEDVLLFRERKQYLRAIQDALAGAEAARVVLEGVVRRMGRGRRWPAAVGLLTAAATEGFGSTEPATARAGWAGCCRLQRLDEAQNQHTRKQDPAQNHGPTGQVV